jgi:hypothetical protein
MKGKLQRVDQYLSDLPSGLASYATIELKASLCRQFVEVVPFGDTLASLSPTLSNWVKNARTELSWMPEVHANAIHLAACDLVLGSDAALLDAVYETSRRAFRNPLFKIALMAASPAMLMRAAEPRWHAFHRGGFTFKTSRRASSRFALQLSYPTHLLPPLMAKAYAKIFQAGFEPTFGKDTVVELESYTPTTALYEARA